MSTVRLTSEEVLALMERVVVATEQLAAAMAERAAMSEHLHEPAADERA